MNKLIKFLGCISIFFVLSAIFIAMVVIDYGSFDTAMVGFSMWFAYLPTRFFIKWINGDFK